MANAITEMLQCSVCGEARPTTQFHRDTRSSSGFDPRCKPCRAARARERYNADIEASRAYGRAHQRQHRLRKQYGLTESDWMDMLVRQHGRCAICEYEPADGRELVVDHDHDTGAVRQLLCNNCNVIIGMAGDDVQRLRNAITYLLRHTTNPDKEQ